MFLLLPSLCVPSCPLWLVGRALPITRSRAITGSPDLSQRPLQRVLQHPRQRSLKLIKYRLQIGSRRQIWTLTVRLLESGAPGDASVLLYARIRQLRSKLYADLRGAGARRRRINSRLNGLQNRIQQRAAARRQKIRSRPALRSRPGKIFLYVLRALIHQVFERAMDLNHDPRRKRRQRLLEPLLAGLVDGEIEHGSTGIV